jgi:hypothetical protein
MSGYQVELAGHLDLSWGDWLGAATVIHRPDGNTFLTVSRLDQSALLGLLLRLHGLGLELVSLRSTKGK